MMVIDRNMYGQAKVIFNVIFKTLSRLIKSAFVSYELCRYQNAWFNDRKKVGATIIILNDFNCLTILY